MNNYSSGFFSGLVVGTIITLTSYWFCGSILLRKTLREDTIGWKNQQSSTDVTEHLQDAKTALEK